MPDYTPPPSTGGGGGGSSITAGDTSVAITDSGTGHVAVTVDGNEVTRFEASGNVKVAHATAQIQTIDTTNNYAGTIKGGGGPRIQFGDTDSSVDSFMDMGAYGGINNIDTQSRDFKIHGTTANPHLYIDENEARVGIGLSSPSATLDVKDTGTFRSTRLLTVNVSDGTTLTEAAHAGRYLLAPAGTVTLPATSTAGEHYTILNTGLGNITVARNGNTINGASSDLTVATFKGITCIAVGLNAWIALGA